MSSDAPVIMFLSTGRCGTQWLARNLAEIHPELTVTHEPIGPLYSPRRFFRAWEEPESILSVPEVAEHVAAISACQTPYVETGWPLFPVLPLLARLLPSRLRVVHLTRHPVPTSLSHLAHSSYAGSPRDDAFTRLATLGPEDPNVFGAEDASRWSAFSPYEKCLFSWTEVNLFGLEVAERLPKTPQLRLRSEDMFDPRTDTLETLLAFMGLIRDPRWERQADRVIDRWHHHTDLDLDPLRIREHPRTLRVARELGYDAQDVDPARLQKRYAGTPASGEDRIGRYEPGTTAA